MSLNRYEQRVFDYLQGHHEERHHWQQKFRAVAKAAGDDHTTNVKPTKSDKMRMLTSVARNSLCTPTQWRPRAVLLYYDRVKLLMQRTRVSPMMFLNLLQQTPSEQLLPSRFRRRRRRHCRKWRFVVPPWLQADLRLRHLLCRLILHPQISMMQSLSQSQSRPKHRLRVRNNEEFESCGWWCCRFSLQLLWPLELSEAFAARGVARLDHQHQQKQSSWGRRPRRQPQMLQRRTPPTIQRRRQEW